MSYSEPESDLESELEGELAEDQPANYIQECLAEADRTYQAWSTPPTPPPAPPPATSDVQPAKTTRPTTHRGRGYLLTLLSSPVLVSEDNAQPDAENLPATSSTSSTSSTLSTSSRIVPNQTNNEGAALCTEDRDPSRRSTKNGNRGRKRGDRGGPLVHKPTDASQSEVPRPPKRNLAPLQLVRQNKE